MKTETNYNTDRSTLAFSIDLMEELKVEKSNNIQNEEEFIDLIGRDAYNELELTHDKFCEVLGIDGDFNHSFWTLMINAGKTSSEFHGMKYGCLCSTLYLNNSCSSLIQVSIALPQYTTILWKPAPKQYSVRRCKINQTLKHSTNKMIGVLRHGFMNGVIGDTENIWQNNWWEGNPFNTNYDNFKVVDKKDKKQPSNKRYIFDEVKTKGKIFRKCLVTINYAKDAHIITIDNKIAFITTSHFDVPQAWETLTGIKDVGYNSDKGTRIYHTTEKTFEYKKYFCDKVTYDQEVEIVESFEKETV